MKKVLAFLAVLSCAVSASSASMFSYWLEVTAPDQSNKYTVSLYGQILPSPSIPGESITNSGFQAMRFGIQTPGTVGVTEPICNPDSTTVVTEWGAAFSSWATKDKGLLEDPNLDGDWDAGGFFLADASGTNKTIGTTGAVLICSQTWKNLTGGRVTLMPYYINGWHWVNNTSSTSGFNAVQMSNAVFTLPTPVAAPVISLTTPCATVNTSSKGGLTATGVQFTASKIAGSDATSGEIGGIPFGTLPATVTKNLTITNGTASQIFIVSATASNGGGTSEEATATVNVVQAPKIHLLVNGIEATPSEIFDSPEFLRDNTVTLSVATSEGYFTGISIVNPTTGLNFAGLTWTGNSNELYGPGVTATIFNTGTGLNSDSIMVQFIPEPATLAMLAVGAVGTIIRRRKQTRLRRGSCRIVEEA